MQDAPNRVKQIVRAITRQTPSDEDRGCDPNLSCSAGALLSLGRACTLASTLALRARREQVRPPPLGECAPLLRPIRLARRRAAASRFQSGERELHAFRLKAGTSCWRSYLTFALRGSSSSAVSPPLANRA